MKKFSIILPFRDTSLERKFAEKSLPSAIALNPDELIIGVDSPADSSLIDLILNLCQQFKDVNIVQVPRSNEWNFQLANVLWSCFEECKNDVVFVGFIDTVFKPVLLEGLDYIGQNNNLVVSFPLRPLTRNLGEWIRYLSVLWTIRKKKHVYGGTSWLYLPYIYEDVDKKGMQKLYNGVDTYMERCIVNAGRHKMITLLKQGGQSMSLENPDYPWRQFEWGVWKYANIDVEKKKRLQRGRGALSRLLTYIINRFPVLPVLKLSFTRQHQWRLRGWLWAKKNPTNIAVTKARDVSYEVYSFEGAKYIRDIHDWGKHGITGTGFK